MKKALFILLVIFCSFRAKVYNGPIKEVAWEQYMLDSMTLEEKIGQLFMVAAYSNKGQEHVTQIENLIEKNHIGGLIFFQGKTDRQLELTNYYQNISKTPLFIGIDGEWGINMRLSDARKYPYQMTLGSLPNKELVYEMGKEIGKECKAMGIHMNFAPVADINNNPKNPIINFRSFGENKNKVAEYALAYALGMQNQNIIACAKHFPGHGDTETDSHLGLPTLPFTKERLDSLELYPFKYLFSNGVISTMVAHMHVPVYDNRKNRATSISKNVVTGLLKDSLKFKGLAITDALNMQGVSKYFSPGNVELEAFLAGNDILLFPENVPAAVKKIKQAILNNQLSLEELNSRVKKILYYKKWVGLDNYSPLQKNYKDSIIKPERTSALIQRIAEKTICLVKNKDFIPLKNENDAIIIEIGGKNTHFSKKMHIMHHFLPKNPNSSQILAAKKAINKKKKVIFVLTDSKVWSTKSFGYSTSVYSLINNTKKEKLILPFTNAYILKNFANCKNILLAYEDGKEFQITAAKIVKGEIGTLGKLPVSVDNYNYGTGIQLHSSNSYLPYSSPSHEGVSDNLKHAIEPHLQELVKKRAAPGGQVLVARNGKIIYEKAFGFHTYEKKQPVQLTDLYDIASITKVAATTLSVMKLQEEGLLSLDDPICKHLPDLESCNKNDVKIRDILLHQARLKNWIPFYLQTLPDRDSFYSDNKTADKSIPVTDKLYTDSSIINHIYKEIKYSPLYPKKKYVYSDLGMILLKYAIENITKIPFEEYVQNTFYKPLGLSHTTYLPLQKFRQESIAPTEEDTLFRKQIIRGTVHDPASAMMGGVAGHAGIFSNARELAVLFQMLLNKGTYNNTKFFEPSTIEYFTDRHGYNSRRGMGFDKKENNPRNRMNLIDEVSFKAFGHTGFTGTAVWADPKYNLVYIFLSNRTFPDQENKTLIRGNYRTEIQKEVYKAILK